MLIDLHTEKKNENFVVIKCFLFQIDFSAAGEQVPINELDANVVELYAQDRRANFEQYFLPFKKLCRTLKVSLFLIF